MAKLQLNNDNMGKDLRAGLSLYKDKFRHAEIYYHFGNSTICFSARNQTIQPLITTSFNPHLGFLALSIRVTKSRYEFYYQVDRHKGWKCLGSMDSMEMTTRDFTGTVIGIFANGNEEEEQLFVSFENFRLGNLLEAP